MWLTDVLVGGPDDIELETFLRPIFYESGIGDRYERLYGVQVYPPQD